MPICMLLLQNDKKEISRMANSWYIIQDKFPSYIYNPCQNVRMCPLSPIGASPASNVLIFIISASQFNKLTTIYIHVYIISIMEYGTIIYIYIYILTDAYRFTDHTDTVGQIRVLNYPYIALLSDQVWLSTFEHLSFWLFCYRPLNKWHIWTYINGKISNCKNLSLFANTGKKVH